MTMHVLQFVGESIQQELCNSTDVNHMTALHLACINGQLNSCKALLLAGADPDAARQRWHDAFELRVPAFPQEGGRLHHEHDAAALASHPIPDNEGVSATSTGRRSSAEQHVGSRDSNSRNLLILNMSWVLGTTVRDASFQQLQDFQWSEGNGPEATSRSRTAAKYFFSIFRQVFVTFSVEVSVKDEHSIFMVGDVQPLGSGTLPKLCFCLFSRMVGKHWSVTLKIKAGSRSRYKFLIAAERNGAMNGCVKRWESLPQETFPSTPRDSPEGSAQKSVGAVFWPVWDGRAVAVQVDAAQALLRLKPSGRQRSHSAARWP